MKDYLSSTERLALVAILKNAEQLLTFTDGDLFTNKEKGDLKRAHTLTYKTVASMLIRVNKTAFKAFEKAANNTKVYVSSNADIDIYKKKKSAEIEASYEENKEYFELVELIMFYNCENCTMCGKDCLFYKAFEENAIPEFDGAEHNKNCKYSYKGVEANAKGTKGTV